MLNSKDKMRVIGDSDSKSDDVNNNKNSDDDVSEEEEEEVLESWARIQQTTFLNWINDKLNVYGIQCQNLTKDLKVSSILVHIFSKIVRASP